MPKRNLEIRLPRLATLVFLLIVGGFLATPASAASPGQWSDPNVVAEASSGIDNTQVVSDSNGNMTALWIEWGGSFYVVYTAFKAVGGSWSTSEALSPPNQGADSAKLVIDNSGNLTALWRTDANPGFVLQFASKLQNGSWSTREDITEVETFIEGISVIVETSGRVTASWVISANSQKQLFSALKPNGGEWSNPVPVSTEVASIDATGLVVDTQGVVTAIWGQSDGSIPSVGTASRNTDGAWGSAQVLSPAGYPGFGPLITIDGSGTATAIWTLNTGTSLVAQSSRKPSGGSWESASTEVGLGESFSLSDLASDAMGNLTVLGFDPVDTTLLATTRPIGGSWSSKVPLSDPTYEAYSPELVVDQSGNTTAVWERANMTDSQFVVQASTRTIDGNWSQAINISPLSGDNVKPSLSIGESGKVIVAWSYLDNPNFQIQYSTMTWEYTLSYSANGGSGSTPLNLVIAGGVPTSVATGSALTRPGFVFTGWNTRADGRGTPYAAGTSIQLSSDTTLYAQWTPELAETGNDGSAQNITAWFAGIMLMSGLLLLARRRILN